ncbi:hypothetical protein Hs30E_16370 [Lactococcus hodotermopsidis]|uniref:Uncharacterized protein n=1 Tax=Pseudolactococcus hodotermopsidis TaxID=2709157 RepID=A0A6A0BE57_9LACT|nr:RCC1 domain-containing protein [Lactococcus hodotermopsidis]GFH43086.1 hypothetical protein Hs30E_16370 [Lactococcus hodotermopsidis]
MKIKKILGIIATLLTVFVVKNTVDAATVIQNNNGIFYAWGDNNYGQLGTGNTTNVPESEKVNLAQIAMYPSSPTYDAAGKFVKVVQVEGAIIAMDAYGALWTSGRNNVGQLGRGLATDAIAKKFEKVSGKYTFSDFTVSNSTIIASVKDRAGEFITFGKQTPNFNFMPQPASKYFDTLPFSWVSNRPVYYKKVGNNVTEIQQFEKYNDFTVKVKGSLETNQYNPDNTIGHVNVYNLQKYSGGKTTPDQRLQYFYDYDSTYLKVTADTKLDAEGFKSTVDMNYYDTKGFKTKHFVPTFQKGNNVESAEWIEDYSAKDGSKKTYTKKYDANGLVYPYAPEYTTDRNSKGGVWISMEETDYDKNGKKILYALSKYDQTNKKTNYREFQYIWLYSPLNGNTTKYSELQYDPTIENKQLRTVANGYSETVSRLRLSGWEDEVINVANPGNRTTTSKQFSDDGQMTNRLITYYDVKKVKTKTLYTKYDSAGKLISTETKTFNASGAVTSTVVKK